MKLKDFLQPYCSLLDTLFTIKDVKETKVLNFKGTDLAYTKTAIWNKDTLEFEHIDDCLLEGIVITWGAYTSNSKTIITVYVRMVDYE